MADKAMKRLRLKFAQKPINKGYIEDMGHSNMRKLFYLVWFETKIMILQEKNRLKGHVQQQSNSGILKLVFIVYIVYI